jgi:regulator of ribonuclease activity A
VSWATADVSDRDPPGLQVAEPLFTSFGGRTSFHGPIRTLKVHEDNSLVRQTLEQPGEECVLVVDGGGSRRCALLGDVLGELAVHNGWAGVVLYGCVRDVAALAELDLGVMALAAHPLKSQKHGVGQSQLPVRFAGVTFRPGYLLVADRDGILTMEAR